MRLAILFAVTLTTAFAQRTSPTGFGRLLYPGTGGPTAPVRGFVGSGFGAAPGGFGRIVYPGTGAPAAIRPGFAPAFVGGVPQRPTHLQHNRSSIIPFPVFYGGGYYGAYEPPPAVSAYDQYYYSSAAERPPIVIINQSFQPDQINPVTRDYSNTPLPQAAPRPATPAQTIPQAAVRDLRDEDPTIYLIAMTDGTVFDSVAYWVEGDTLNYITLEGSHNRATLDLVDRDRSKRLNDERRVEFKLPKR